MTLLSLRRMRAVAFRQLVALAVLGTAAQAQDGSENSQEQTESAAETRVDERAAQAWSAYRDRDYFTALQIWESMAEEGDAYAQFNLGVLYRKGRGVAINDATAFDWFRRAAENGQAEAQNNLGFMYYHGEGVSQDLAAAAGWYRKAAMQGNAAAQNNLGLMLYRGEGGPKDYVQAYKWFALAAAGARKDDVRKDAAWNLDLVRLNLPIEAIATAEQLAAMWKPGDS